MRIGAVREGANGAQHFFGELLVLGIDHQDAVRAEQHGDAAAGGVRMGRVEFGRTLQNVEVGRQLRRHRNRRSCPTAQTGAAAPEPTRERERAITGQPSQQQPCVFHGRILHPQPSNIAFADRCSAAHTKMVALPSWLRDGMSLREPFPSARKNGAALRPCRVVAAVLVHRTSHLPTIGIRVCLNASATSHQTAAKRHASRRF